MLVWWNIPLTPELIATFDRILSVTSLIPSKPVNRLILGTFSAQDSWYISAMKILPNLFLVQLFDIRTELMTNFVIQWHYFDDDHQCKILVFLSNMDLCDYWSLCHHPKPVENLHITPPLLPIFLTIHRLSPLFSQLETNDYQESISTWKLWPLEM